MPNYHPTPRGKFPTINPGDVFGKLTVIGPGPEKVYPSGVVRKTCECLCECGQKKVATISDLVHGLNKSCGCLQVDAHRKHGDSRNCAEYRIWHGLKARCLDLKNTAYHRYGGRGITVCERWRESYPNFLADMGRRPSPGHSIDRIDNNGNYEPGNCRWATHKEQQNNMASNVLIECGGMWLSATQWSEISGTNASTLIGRVSRGWRTEDAIFAKPFRRRNLIR